MMANGRQMLLQKFQLRPEIVVAEAGLVSGNWERLGRVFARSVEK
jgi:hypothetical protein